ncbi:hypothetical protein Vafri_9298 [Volvox africanus]|uniref:Uncharacterized protein n=1 Tax=Volvox africanus TaxID=51714 RepID=A0A8J4B408_9CHLO|nr:hypothetical protein Vafri_9298 [Volvox africanus]
MTTQNNVIIWVVALMMIPLQRQEQLLVVGSYSSTAIECPEPHRTILQQYKDFHNKNKYSPNAQYLVEECWNNGCAGAGDRIRGALFTLRVAIQYKKIWLIDWTRPAPITNFLIHNEVDWRVTGFPDNFFKEPNTLTLDEFNATTFHGNGSEAAVVEKFMAAKKYVIIGAQHFEDRATRLNPVDPEHAIEIGACYFQFLFKLNDTIVKSGESHLRELYGPAPVDYVAWHWRHMDVDFPGEKPLLVSQLAGALDCGRTLAAEIKVDLVRRPMVLITDFHVFRQFVMRGEFQNIRTINITAQHIDRDSNKNVTMQSYQEVFVDLYVLSRARCMLTSWSGYSKLALWMGTAPLLKCHRDWVHCNITTVQNVKRIR